MPKDDPHRADHIRCDAEIPEPITERMRRVPAKIRLYECHGDMHIHGYARMAIKMTKYTEVDPFNYHIYTDASVPGEKTAAAWSMALIAESEDDFHFHGQIGHLISGSTALAIDCNPLDSTQAELVAINWALILATQLEADVSASICTDSKSAIDIITTATSKADPISILAIST
eukprot:1562598-Pyramimonas_sp.AAC.1